MSKNKGYPSWYFCFNNWMKSVRENSLNANENLETVKRHYDLLNSFDQLRADEKMQLTYSKLSKPEGD
jgi:hypothetical protein